jgi:hypothetical protein
MEKIDFSDLVEDIGENEPEKTPILEKEEPIEEVQKEVKNEIEIVPVISLVEWFSSNKELIFETSGIATLGLKLKGIYPDDYLVLTIPSPTNQDPEKRSLIVIPNPGNIYVLDLPPIFVKVSPTSITVISKLKDKAIKMYNTFSQKSVLVRNPTIEVSICTIVDWSRLFDDMEGEAFIPYKVVQISKKEFEDTMQVKLDILDINEEKQISLLESKAPIEELIVKYYSQLQTQAATAKTWKDVARYLLRKQELIFDVNHMLQIDKTLSILFTYM